MENRTIVMLVEDDPTAEREIREPLTERGYRVLPTLTSGEEAIKAVAAFAPDLIIMDVVLSGELDGVETARIIRAQHQIPILFITSVADERAVHRTGSKPPLAYLLKPIEPSLLDTVISIVLLKKQNQGIGLEVADTASLAPMPAIKPPDAVTMCGWCYKIQQGDTWMPPVANITHHAKSTISHGICPACCQRFFPSLGMPSSIGRKPDRPA